MFLYTGFPRIALSERPFIPAVNRPRPNGQDIAVQVPTSKAGLPLDNKLLGSLPRDHFDRLLPNLVSVNLPQGLVLNEAGDEVDQVYFPQNGMLSLLAVLRDGKAIETATVGREGVVGAMAGFGLYRARVRAMVRLPKGVSMISAAKFRESTANSDANPIALIQRHED